MGNTTKWISQTEKMKLVKRIQEMPETRDKHILSDVFIKEMSCKQVADSMKYYSNRGTPISHRQVVNVVKGFYPEYGYSGVSKGKGRPQGEARLQTKDFKFEIIAERGCKCELCGISGKYLELHHKIPVAFGGTTTKENVLLVCEACHKHLTSKQKWGEFHKGWQERNDA